MYTVVVFQQIDDRSRGRRVVVGEGVLSSLKLVFRFLDMLSFFFFFLFFACQICLVLALLLLFFSFFLLLDMMIN